MGNLGWIYMRGDEPIFFSSSATLESTKTVSLGLCSLAPREKQSMIRSKGGSLLIWKDRQAQRRWAASMTPPSSSNLGQQRWLHSSLLTILSGKQTRLAKADKILSLTLKDKAKVRQNSRMSLCYFTSTTWRPENLCPSHRTKDKFTEYEGKAQ